MRKAVAIVVLLMLAYTAWPLANMYMLATSAQKADLDGLNAGVDWVQVRTHLKSDLDGVLSDKVAEPSSNKLVNLLMKELAPKVANEFTAKLIDKTVTPENVVRIVNTANSASGGDDPDKDATETEMLQDPLKYLNWAFFTGPTTFDVRIRPDRNKPYTEFKFELSGLRWKLVRITPPKDFSFT